MQSNILKNSILYWTAEPLPVKRSRRTEMAQLAVKKRSLLERRFIRSSEFLTCHRPRRIQPNRLLVPMGKKGTDLFLERQNQKGSFCCWRKQNLVTPTRLSIAHKAPILTRFFGCHKCQYHEKYHVQKILRNARENCWLNAATQHRRLPSAPWLPAASPPCSWQ